MIEDLPLNGRTVLSLASLSAGVTPRNFARGTPVRPPQPVHHRRRRPRQLDQLHHRRRVCAFAALQQSLAEPARRRRAGSEPAPELVLHRVRPGAGRGVDRDEVGHEPAARLGYEFYRTIGSMRATSSRRRSRTTSAISSAPRPAGRWCATSSSCSARMRACARSRGSRSSAACRARRSSPAISRRWPRRFAIR